MNLIKFFKVLSVFLMIVTAGLVPAGYTYTDEILTTREELWTAVQDAVTPEKIRHADAQAYILTTKWIEDAVTKQKNILPDALGRGVILPSTVRRRYRLTIQLEEMKTGTKIAISGKYQERPVGSPEHQSRWKTTKPETEDYELERALFFKVLSELSRVRTAVS